MVDSQSRLGSLQVRALGAGGEEEEEAAAPELVFTCWGCLKWTLIPNIISVLLGSRPPWASPAAYNGGDGSLWYLNYSPQLRFTFFPFLFSHSCMFLIGVWRIIGILARSTLATIPSRRRRVFFLVRLKNRRILSLCSLCLSRNAHDSGGIFFVQGKWKKKKKTWNFCRVPRLVDVEMVISRCLI